MCPVPDVQGFTLCPALPKELAGRKNVITSTEFQQAVLTIL